MRKGHKPKTAFRTRYGQYEYKVMPFLGYIVKTSGVTMSDSKVKSVQNWAHPRSVTEVQIFIGCANFY